MNHFFGIGRLTSAAELKNIGNNGTPQVKFSICINKYWKNKDGERQDKPNFFNCIVWGKYGETMHKYLTKGKLIAIEGELEQDAWTDGNGGKHNVVQINISEINLLSSPKNEKENSEAAANKKPDDVPF